MSRIADTEDDLLPAAEAAAAEPLPASSGKSTVVGLFKSRAKLIRNLLRWRLRSDDDAQDASQEVFLRLWRREQTGVLNEDASSYLMCSVYNAATDVERWRSVHRPDDKMPLDEAIVPSHDPEAVEALFWRHALEHFTEVLNELPATTCQIFLLYHVEGAPHTEIARRLGMNVRTVERHMRRAMNHCRDRMKDYLE
jgi:RNA polymerase sigma factor (sigma-70 family)